ncbi:MAG: RDD family protein [Aeromicrobium sp.]|uniref:RDD family protein n=1 Tax=Aeromicrobium sp. TaxID=1871063 RepID=UPI003C69FE30
MTDGPQYPTYPGEQPQQPVPSQSAPPPGYGQPPPGYNPPPAAGAGAQQPASPYTAGQYPPVYVPPGQYATWWSRVGASLIDSLIALLILVVPLGVGLFQAFRDADVDPGTGEITGGVEPAGFILVGVGLLAYLAFDIWNRVFRMGRTGQSIGKKAVGIRVVAISHGGPIGLGAACGRWAVATFAGFVLGCLALIDVLWPLWDEKKQALHDKVVGSVVLRARS